MFKTIPPENAWTQEGFKVLAVSVVAHFGYKGYQTRGDFTLHSHTGPCSMLDEGSPSLGTLSFSSKSPALIPLVALA